MHCPSITRQVTGKAKAKITEDNLCRTGFTTSEGALKSFKSQVKEQKENEETAERQRRQYKLIKTKKRLQFTLGAY